MIGSSGEAYRRSTSVSIRIVMLPALDLHQASTTCEIATLFAFLAVSVGRLSTNWTAVGMLKSHIYRDSLRLDARFASLGPRIGRYLRHLDHTLCRGEEWRS